MTHGPSVHSERPERSRNAKAQARHRAKRKTYMEQLEQKITKLQTALGFSPEQFPPPLLKIRELEQEISKLQKENDETRRMLANSGRGHLPVEMTHRNSLSSFHDARACDIKRRKMNGDEVYMSPGDTLPHGDVLSRPPSLTIPQPKSHHYGSMVHRTSSQSNGFSCLYSLHAPVSQLPNTPSVSSSASSPPFSPADMQSASHSPVLHRHPSISHHHNMTSYSHATDPYGSVKVEDEHYASSNLHHHTSHPNHYSIASFAHTPQHDIDSWHAYSSERAVLHR